MNTWKYTNKPAPMTTIHLTVYSAGRIPVPTTYHGTVLNYDESGEFALIAWHGEEGGRDYRYIHQGYDAQMNETMEW